MSKVTVAELSQELIESALDGEPAAFRAFYERYDPSVRWAVGLRIYRWPQLVPQFEDIVQEVWCALIRNQCKRLRYHDRDRGLPFSRFLTLIATRLGWKIAKRRLEHPEMGPMALDEEDDDDFAAQLMQADLLDRLADLVDRRLEPPDRALFHGYYVQGERLKDVGARLGMNENATYKRNERLLGKLKKLAEELLDDPAAQVSPELVAVALAVLFLTPLKDMPAGPDATMMENGQEVRRWAMSKGSMAELVGAYVVTQDPEAVVWLRVACGEPDADETVVQLLDALEPHETRERREVENAKVVFEPPPAERRAAVLEVLEARRRAEERVVVATSRFRWRGGVVALALAAAAVLLFSLRVILSSEEPFSGAYVVELEKAAVSIRGGGLQGETPRFLPDGPIRIRLVPEEAVHGELGVVVFAVDRSTEVRRLNVEPKVHASGLVEIDTNVTDLGLDVGSWELVIAIGRPGALPSSWEDLPRAGARGGEYEIVRQRLEVVTRL